MELAVRIASFPAHRDRLDLVAGRILENDRFAQHLEGDEIVFVVEPSVVEHDAVRLGRELEADVELVALG